MPFSIAIRSLQREAIRLDPHWNGGHYDDTRYPESGMRMARKLGVITYRSALEWDGRFGRVRLDSEQAADDPFGLEFQVESYLEGHARRFVRFFDPNCYLYLSRSMDWFDLAEYVDDKPVIDAGVDGQQVDNSHLAAKPDTGVSTDATVLAGLAQIRIARALAIGANTDILFPVQQQEQIAEGLRAGGADAQFWGWIRHKATTPSWSISRASVRPCATFWTLADLQNRATASCPAAASWTAAQDASHAVLDRHGSDSGCRSTAGAAGTVVRGRQCGGDDRLPARQERSTARPATHTGNELAHHRAARRMAGGIVCARAVPTQVQQGGLPAAVLDHRRGKRRHVVCGIAPACTDECVTRVAGVSDARAMPVRAKIDAKTYNTSPTRHGMGRHLFAAGASKETRQRNSSNTPARMR